jgi:hypothetical protein
MPRQWRQWSPPADAIATAMKVVIAITITTEANFFTWSLLPVSLRGFFTKCCCAILNKLSPWSRFD